MPSFISSLFKVVIRVVVTVFINEYYPKKYLRFVYSNVLPLLSTKIPGVSYEELEVSGIPAAQRADEIGDLVAVYAAGGKGEEEAGVLSLVVGGERPGRGQALPVELVGLLGGLAPGCPSAAHAGGGGEAALV
jgi:hypothetical protein